MKTIRAMFLALAGAAVILPGTALAQPLRCEFNGNHYEVIDFSCDAYADAEACWNAALTEARSRTYAGAFGKLITITSPGEQHCVAEAWTQWKDAKAHPPTPFEVWIGGFQDDGAHDVGDNWKWIDGDGDIPGTNNPHPPTGYANWDGGEPNDVPHTPYVEDGEEDFLGFGLGEVPKWNDEGNENNIVGIGIEYETATVIENIDECLDPDGCPLNDDLNIFYEDIVCEVNPGDPSCPDAELRARSWQVTDPPGRCGHQLLNITELLDGNLEVVASDEPVPNADTILPRYLCGHPTIVVTKTEVDGFKIGNTAAIIESEPVAGNEYQKCGPLGLTSPIDNTVWDVTAYQTTNKAQMVETHVPLTGINQLFAGGTVLESLFDCGTSRGKGFRDSWYFSGLCISFGGQGCPTGAGPSHDPGAPPPTLIDADNFNLMNKLLIYKLRRTIEVLDEAKRNRAFKRFRDYRVMRNRLLSAIWKTRHGFYGAALLNIKSAQHRLARTRFRDVSDERYPAELDTRLSNAAFTSKERIVQYLNLH